MGALCYCLNPEYDASEQKQIKAIKVSTRLDILKSSLMKSDMADTSAISKPKSNKHQYHYPLRESSNPFPQKINEDGRLSIRISCPNRPSDYHHIQFDAHSNVHCFCLNSEINKELFTFFLNKYSIGDYKNHTCALHQIEGVYCPTCTSWICPQCKADYHSKFYPSHHFFLFLPNRQI